MYIELRLEMLGSGHRVDAGRDSDIVSPEHVIGILVDITLEVPGTVRLDLVSTERQLRKRDMSWWMLASICMPIL